MVAVVESASVKAPGNLGVLVRIECQIVIASNADNVLNVVEFLEKLAQVLDLIERRDKIPNQEILPKAKMVLFGM